MKTTIDLPDNLIRAVKIRAAQQGRTVRELVAEYINAGLNQHATASTASHDLGLPIIPAQSDAPLATMTREAIINSEAEALSDKVANAD